MGELGAALPRQQTGEKAEIKSENGVYKAIFLGLSAPFQFVSNFANERCRLCKGEGTGIRGEGKCSSCNGSGRRTEQCDPDPRLVSRGESRSALEKRPERDFRPTTGASPSSDSQRAPSREIGRSFAREMRDRGPLIARETAIQSARSQRLRDGRT